MILKLSNVQNHFQIRIKYDQQQQDQMYSKKNFIAFLFRLSLMQKIQ
jgi:hypothetical protein